jgi:hypothetical protein
MGWRGFAHLKTAGRFAVLPQHLQLWADESNFGDDAIDGHELIQMLGKKCPGVEQLRRGGETTLTGKNAHARRLTCVPRRPSNPTCSCRTSVSVPPINFIFMNAGSSWDATI